MSAAVLSKVKEVLKEIFDINPHLVSLETKALDVPGWDSVGHLSLCGALEEAFEIVFDGSEMAQMDSVRTVVCIVERKRQLAAGA